MVSACITRAREHRLCAGAVSRLMPLPDSCERYRPHNKDTPTPQHTHLKPFTPLGKGSVAVAAPVHRCTPTHPPALGT
jgi:hypothetical protein